MRAGTANLQLVFLIDEIFLADLEQLPWDHAIVAWRALGVRHFEIKRGVGRHPVVFVQAGQRKYVVKELGLEVSLREVENYKALLQRGIHTLIPAGCVARAEAPLEIMTPIGRQFQRDTLGHTVTLLIDHVLPDSQLYRRAFNLENRKKIWDAIIDLFVELHSNGVYWGDASLANTLVKFTKVDIPHLGRKTRLKAFLADAETVEIHAALTDSLRQADLDFFFESMGWIDEDLRASGMIRDELATGADKQYLRENYQKSCEAALQSRDFEARSGLQLKTILGTVKEARYLTTLQKHIEEHKWYLSEQQQREVNFTTAAHDWLHAIFIPLCELFRREGLLELFPGKTASELYVDIMTNKYYLNESAGKDVGMIRATHDYAERFGQQPPPASFWHGVTSSMLKILGMREQALLAK